MHEHRSKNGHEDTWDSELCITSGDRKLEIMRNRAELLEQVIKRTTVVQAHRNLTCKDRNIQRNAEIIHIRYGGASLVVANGYHEAALTCYLLAASQTREAFAKS